MIEYALFDLDETLYPRESGLLQLVGQRIESYLIERLHMTPQEAARLRAEYRERYGTTLGGLLAQRLADPEDYLLYVHDIPVEEIIRPDPELDRVLGELPWECAIFTNSDWRHTERVLAALGIRRHFRRIFDIVSTGYQQKPRPAAYECVLKELSIPGSACLIADDSLKNLMAAKDWQMTTVWVGPNTTVTEGVDFAIPQIAAIAEVAAQIRARGKPYPPPTTGTAGMPTG